MIKTRHVTEYKITDAYPLVKQNLRASEWLSTEPRLVYEGGKANPPTTVNCVKLGDLFNTDLGIDSYITKMSGFFESFDAGAFGYLQVYLIGYLDADEQQAEPIGMCVFDCNGSDWQHFDGMPSLVHGTNGLLMGGSEYEKDYVRKELIMFYTVADNDAMSQSIAVPNYFQVANDTDVVIIMEQIG